MWTDGQGIEEVGNYREGGGGVLLNRQVIYIQGRDIYVRVPLVTYVPT